MTELTDHTKTILRAMADGKRIEYLDETKHKQWWTASLDAVVYYVKNQAEKKHLRVAAEQAPQPSDIEKELQEVKDSRDWYKRRCNALQACQSTMRDPERTMVCDILANGSLLLDGQGKLAASRYQPTQPAELAEPVAAFQCHMCNYEQYTGDMACGNCGRMFQVEQAPQPTELTDAAVADALAAWFSKEFEYNSSMETRMRAAVLAAQGVRK